MKLELKHLAPYLPYALKCRVTDLNRITTSEMHSVYSDGSCTFHDLIESEQAFSDIKPILRPLSDLHCDFEVDDCNVYNSLSARSRSDLNYLTPSYLKWSYKDIQILLKHHFDIFDLIEKGLAVSIHDVG
jgi:hypothetical protein